MTKKLFSFVVSGFTVNSSEDMATIISETTRFDVKHDGSCGALVWDPIEQKYVLFARFDIKKKNGVFSPPIGTVQKDGKNVQVELDTSAWIPCEPKPTDDATHWPHFRPCHEDKAAYKWYIDAFEDSQSFISTMSPSVYGNIVTIEYMGPKFNDPIGKKVGSPPMKIKSETFGGLKRDKELQTFPKIYDFSKTNFIQRKF